MSRALDDLSPEFKPKAIELIARIVEHNIAVMIINTLRTQAEQNINIATGHSWVEHSLHQDGLAIDLCPYEVWNEKGVNKLAWNSYNPNWQIMGTIGKNLGLRWGGDWKVKDMGHFEFVKPGVV